MTKHILFSVFSLLFIFVSISNALEIQEKGFRSNDWVPREADAVNAVISDTEGTSLSEEVVLSRLTRAADTSKGKKKFRKSKMKNNKKRKNKARKNKGKAKKKNQKAREYEW